MAPFVNKNIEMNCIQNGVSYPFKSISQIIEKWSQWACVYLQDIVHFISSWISGKKTINSKQEAFRERRHLQFCDLWPWVVTLTYIEVNCIQNGAAYPFKSISQIIEKLITMGLCIPWKYCLLHFLLKITR